MSEEEIHKLCCGAMDKAIAHIQEKLGIEYGDFAGIYFTGENRTNLNQAVATLEQYTKAEVEVLGKNPHSSG